MDNADLIEKYELELWDTIHKMNKDGIRYEVIQFVVSEMVKRLEVQGYVENWLHSYNKSH